MIHNIKHHVENKLTGVIHVGAHEGQEMNIYFNMGAHKILWYEANPTVYQKLTDNIRIDDRQSAKNKAVSNFCGRVNFNIETVNHGQSSSILPLKDHVKYYPSVKYTDQVEVECITLDSENLTGYNMLATDAQGSDFNILIGAEKLLKEQIGFVYTEVFVEELYEGCGLLPQVDDYLSTMGFQRKYISGTENGWGDAFYIKTT
jgi:FkbM family methyltransferase